MIVSASPVGIADMSDAAARPADAAPTDDAFALLLAAAGGAPTTVTPQCSVGVTEEVVDPSATPTTTGDDMPTLAGTDERATAMAMRSLIPRLTAPFTTTTAAEQSAAGDGVDLSGLVEKTDARSLDGLTLDDVVLTATTTDVDATNAFPNALVDGLAPVGDAAPAADAGVDAAPSETTTPDADPVATTTVAPTTGAPAPTPPTLTTWSGDSGTNDRKGAGTPTPTVARTDHAAPSAPAAPEATPVADTTPELAPTFTPTTRPGAPTGDVAPTSIGRLVAATVPELRANNNEMRLSVRLDPPSLGHVTVDISSHDGAVHVVVRPSEASATGVLDAQRSAVTAALANAGFELGGFDVRAGDQRDAPRQSTTRRVDGDFDLDAVDLTTTSDDGALRL